MFQFIRLLACVVVIVSVIGCKETHRQQAAGDRGTQSLAITSLQETPSGIQASRTLYQFHSGQNSASLRVSHFRDSRFPPELQFEEKFSDAPNGCVATQNRPTDLHSFALLFQHVLQAETPAQRYTLYINCYHEVDDRMMARAAVDPAWYKLERSDAASSVLYSYLGHLLAAPDIDAELNSVLEPMSYTAQVDTTSLEKLWTTRVDTLDMYQRHALPPNVPGNQIVPLRISKAFLLVQKEANGPRKE